MEELNPFQPPRVETGSPVKQGSDEEVSYFTVSTTKLLLLTLCSFQLYLLYWMYCQWDAVRNSPINRRDLSPFWRTVFSVFFVHELFRGMRQRTSEAGVAGGTSESMLATIYVVALIIGSVGDRLHIPGAWLISFLVILPVYVMQGEVNAAVAKTNPHADMNTRYTPLNIVVIVLGGLLWVLAIIGLLLPGEQ